MLVSADSERSVTRLCGLELGIGEDGTATPLALVEPIPVAGRLVTRASLRNAGFVRDNDVRFGDALTVRAENGTPVVDTVLPLLRTGHEQPIHFPSACPVCGCDLRHLGDEIVCPNATCSPQLAVRVRRLVDAEGFSIPELTPEAIAELIDAGMIQTPADVFRLRELDLLHAGWSAERASSLARSVEQSKKIALARLIVATTGVPVEAANSIAGHARSLARVKRLAAGSLARLPNVGTRAAEAVANFMREPRNRKMLAQIARAGVTTLRVPVHSVV